MISFRLFNSATCLNLATKCTRNAVFVFPYTKDVLYVTSYVPTDLVCSMRRH